MFTFFVDHPPIAQPRPRVTTVGGFARGYVPSKHPVHGYKEAITAAFYGRSGKKQDGPLRCDVVAVMPRPKSKTWKRKPMPTEWHISTPDADNLAKAVLDALNGHAWTDDGQVSILTCQKRIAGGEEVPGVYVTIRQLKGSPDGNSCATKEDPS